MEPTTTHRSRILADGRVLMVTVSGGMRYSVILDRQGNPIVHTYRAQVA